MTTDSRQNPAARNPKTGRRHIHAIFFMTAMIGCFLLLNAAPVFSMTLTLRASAPSSMGQAEINRPGQIPHSRVANGAKNIKAAWLALPTARYQHGVLGDDLEAGRLAVETSSGSIVTIDLPFERVFEDLEPRLADLNEDGADEIMVVESDAKSGASLAVYGMVNGRLKKQAKTLFLGRSQRWLNPVGAGDFDGDGALEIALVATPHIGGILRLYRLNGSRLSLFAEYPGVSTHQIGSVELGMGRVIFSRPRDLILAPNQSREALMLLEWTPAGWNELARATLPDPLESSLTPAGLDLWRFRLENGAHYEIQIER